MEDSHIMYDSFRKEGDGFFCIYDGHGGRNAVDHVQEVLHQHFDFSLKKGKSVKESFVFAYKTTDNELKQKQILYQGATCVTCYIKKDTTQDGKTIRKLYTANCGDARAVICHDGKAHRLSYDHKASDSAESKRVTDSKGFITYGRVNGILAVTRALGDHAIKEWVVCDPYYTELSLTSKDKFLIIACDGVWDVMTDQDAVNLIQEESTAQKMADKLLQKALEKGTTDNLSVMVLIL